MKGTPYMPEFGDVSNADALELSIRAATHLTAKHYGAIQAARSLARKIDSEAELREAYIQLASHQEGESAPRSLQLDNVSAPTYLKHLVELLFTPASEAKSVEVKKPAPKSSPLTLMKSNVKRPSAS